jgi:hypothetical protein
VNDFSVQNCTLGADSLDVSEIDDPQKCKVIFFPPNFSFVFWKREFWRENICLAKECYSKE